MENSLNTVSSDRFGLGSQVPARYCMQRKCKFTAMLYSGTNQSVRTRRMDNPQWACGELRNSFKAVVYYTVFRRWNVYAMISRLRVPCVVPVERSPGAFLQCPGHGCIIEKCDPAGGDLAVQYTACFGPFRKVIFFCVFSVTFQPHDNLLLHVWLQLTWTYCPHSWHGLTYCPLYK